jgi:hypothetical protein
MLNMLTLGVTAAAGVYLVLLGLMAIWRPEPTRRYLAAHAATRAAHLLEMGIRIVVGGALLVTASRMRFSALFVVFGWMLLGTSVLLVLLPWRWHAAFAQRVVPAINQRLSVIALGSLLGGGFLLFAIWSGIDAR